MRKKSIFLVLLFILTSSLPLADMAFAKKKKKGKRSIEVSSKPVDRIPVPTTVVVHIPQLPDDISDEPDAVVVEANISDYCESLDFSIHELILLNTDLLSNLQDLRAAVVSILNEMQSKLSSATAAVNQMLNCFDMMKVTVSCAGPGYSEATDWPNHDPQPDLKDMQTAVNEINSFLTDIDTLIMSTLNRIERLNEILEESTTCLSVSDAISLQAELEAIEDATNNDILTLNSIRTGISNAIASFNSAYVSLKSRIKAFLKKVEQVMRQNRPAFSVRKIINRCGMSRADAQIEVQERQAVVSCLKELNQLVKQLK